MRRLIAVCALPFLLAGCPDKSGKDAKPAASAEPTKTEPAATDPAAQDKSGADKKEDDKGGW